MYKEMRIGKYKLLPFYVVAVLVSGLFLFTFGEIQKVYAASSYAVTEATATVGTATGLEIEYTVDTAAQTWADADTLTVQLPANFPAWGSLTFTAEYDTDANNDAGGETAITAGGGNGQYSVVGDTITIKWDVTTWGAVVNGASTIRILVTAAAVPQYADSTSTFTWGGTTAAVDTDPSGTDDVNVSAADAAASVVLASPTVGATGDTTVTLTVPFALDANDTIDITFPAYINVSGVAAAVTGTFESAANITCAAAGQVVTCTTDGATLTTGTIIMTGITSYYVGTTDITSLEVEDEGVAANDIATDTTVALTDVTAADAAASVVLASPTVGATGDTTVTLTVPFALDAADTIDITFPAYVNVSGVGLATTGTFESAAQITCVAAGQVVTCTTDGATLTTGTIIMTGITSYYVGTTDITDLQVEDEGAAANDIATDTTVALTDVTAADAAASVVLASPTIGGVGDTTVTLTVPFALDAADTIDITFPAYINVSGVGAAVTGTFEAAANITCAAALQVVTCTTDGATLTTGTIIMTGITAGSAGTTDISVFEVEDEGAAANDIATDTTVALTDVVVADAAATVTLAGNSVVGVAGNTTVTLTLPIALDADDTVDITFPAHLSVAAAAFDSETFAGAGTFSGCAAAGQVVTCTAGGAITAGTGNIVMTGITSLYAATTDVSLVEVEDEGIGANDIATDSSVATTDSTAADAGATVTLAGNSVVGVAGDTTLALTLPFALDADDTIELTFPAFINVSGVGAAVTGTLESSDSITCAAAAQLVTCTTSAATNAGGTIVMTGITSSYAGTTDITSLEVEDEGAAANDIATDTTVALTNVTAADAGATVTLAGNSVVGVAGDTTVNLTLPIALANTDTVDITFPAHLNVSAAAFGSETFAGAGTFGGCVAAGQVVTCTANGAITAGNGNIVITGITSSYAATADVSSVEVEAAGAAANDIATDSSVATTDSTAADAAASLTLAANSVVGTAGNTTLTLTLPVALGNLDTIAFTAPANLNVAGATFSSETFAGAGTFSGCAAVGQVVTCTANGAITAGTGNIVMTGITSLYTATGQTITSVAVVDTGNGNVATDASGTVTDTTAADAAASVVLASPTVGATGDTTVTLTVPFALDANDTIDITFPAYINVSGVAAAVTGTFESAANITCAAAGQVVTCTTDGATLTTGTIIMTGITSYYVGTTDITDLQVEDEGVGANDIATDTTVALTNVTAADAAASIVLASPTVGGVGNTTVTLTVPFALDAADTIDITFPAYINVSGVAAAVTGTFESAANITCAAAGQVVTCTTDGATLTTGTIIMTGITASGIGTTDVSVFEVEDEGVAANDIATDSTVALTDVTGADANASVVLASPTVGATGNTTLTLTVPFALDAADTIDITFPAYINVSGVAAAVTGTFESAANITCAAAGQVVTCTTDGATLTTGTIIMTGITSYYVGTTDITDLQVEDEGVGANDIATDTTVALTDVTAADAAATVTLGANSTVGTAGNTTVTLTVPFALDAADTIDITFPAHMSVGSVGAAVTGTFESAANITCAAAGQVVTCTTDGATLTTGTIIMTGITASSAGTTDITDLQVEDEGSAANDIATDTAVALTDAVAAAVTPLCGNSIDDDGDGRIDLNDPGCTDSSDTDEYNDWGGGGGGGGGGAGISSNSNSKTSSTPSNISTITGDQIYSRPVKLSSSSITVDSDNKTKTAQVTENGTLTLKPNSKSTVSLTIPANTGVTADSNWDGRIDPPLVQSVNLVNTKGDKVNGSTDKLMRSDIAVVIKAGSDKSTLTFSKDISIDVPVNLPEGTTIKLYSSKEGDTWDYLGTGVVKNGKVVVTTNHLTYYALANSGGAVATPVMKSMFKDISNHWAKAYIEKIADLGIVNGKTSTTFAPDDQITRAELTKMAVKAFNISVAPSVSSTTFGDVSSSAWYAPYIVAARNKGIVQGVAEGVFSPNAPIDRAAALKILLEASGLKIDTAAASNFSDTDKSAWYMKYVNFAKDKNIVGGYSDGTFKPGNFITRGEAAKIINLILDMNK